MTAIEWLIEQWPIIKSQLPPWLIQQALEMEKQQIINAHLTGLIYPLEMEASKQAEQYYSETYKKDNQ